MSSPTKTFLILLSIPPETEPRDRLLALRSYLTGPTPEGVTVIADCGISGHPTYSFLIVATAAPDLIREALLPTAKLLVPTIVEVIDAQYDGKLSGEGFCLFGGKAPADATLPGAWHSQAMDAVTVRARLKLAAGGPCSEVWLVNAPSPQMACRSHRALRPGAPVTSARAQPGQQYFEHILRANDSPAAPVSAARLETPADSGYSIVNQGSAAAIYSESSQVDPAADYYSLFQNAKTANPGQAYPVHSQVYAWRALSGTFTYELTDPDSGYTDQIVYVATHAPPPDLALPKVGYPVAFDLGSGRVDVLSPLFVWLNDILHSTKYDAANWPEDDYDQEHAAAYNYFLDRIPGRTPPKDGSVPSSLINSIALNYNSPGQTKDPSFSQDVFDEVSMHLSDECRYFELTAKWFDTAGILNAIYTRIGLVSSNDLQAAAQLLEIPETSVVSMILNLIFTVIADILAIIPDIGPALYAVVNIGWTSVQTLLGSGASEPIQVAVAGMADALNKSLEGFYNASATQWAAIKSNWGKLKEFGSGVITGKISEDQFYGQAGAPQGMGGSAPLPGEFLAAVANAWTVIIYKSLLGVSHSFQAQLDWSTNMPSNPWNPANGVYDFTYYMKGVFMQKHDPTYGYIIVHCETTAPRPVLEKLFGAAAGIYVDPLQFFTGSGGWPISNPKVDEGPYGPPIVSIG